MTRLLQLDGLRGVAILCVILHHFGVHAPGWLDWGPVAPSVFFLLSGYLITHSLCRRREAGELSAVDLAGFHARRLIRLLPAFYLMLALGWMAGLEEFREGLAWHASFQTNIRIALDEEWQGSLSHLWSLAMQEQFYLFWPLLILFLPARFLPAALWSSVAAAVVFRAWCLLSGQSELFRWFMFPASLDAFAAGGLVAWYFGRELKVPLHPFLRGSGAALAAVGCWMASKGLRYLDGTGHPVLALVDSFECLFFAWLLIVLLRSEGGWLIRAFSWSPLVWLGRISYGVFLWHMLVVHALGPWLDQAGLTLAAHPWARAGLLTLASVGVASLSWIAIERPFIAWGKRATAPEGFLANAGQRLNRWLTWPSQA